MLFFYLELKFFIMFINFLLFLCSFIYFLYVISIVSCKTSYDSDNRSLLFMRSNLCSSGYDVYGTYQSSLGQFSGRFQQSYKHSVPRFFVPDHGTIVTLALVRFPPTATKE